MTDLRSDTFTVPCSGMLKAIATARTGDDCYGEDPSVRQLEDEVAALFNKEAALFTPTGTMSNQLAIKSQTNPGDEVMIHERYHLYYYEAAPSSGLSGIHFSLIKNRYGSVAEDDIRELVCSKPRGPLYARPVLLILENTVCSMGGKVFKPVQTAAPAKCARSMNMRVHLDGARIMNACAATGSDPGDFAGQVDTVSVCFSKGLGAPMGSVLSGDRGAIEKARTYRKWFGGAMHQSGLMAAACLYALKNVGLAQLARDNFHALRVYTDLLSFLEKSSMIRPESNMLIINCRSLGYKVPEVVRALAQKDILVLPWDDDSIRLVFHRGVCESDVSGLGSVIAGVFAGLRTEQNPEHRTDFPALAANLD